MSEADKNPLAPFARLVGGKWVMGDLFHVFEWGVGKLSMKANSYFVQAGEAALAGDGGWFWHPGDKAIRGWQFAVGMGIDLFDYTTRWEGDKMVNDLTTYDAAGNASEYLEEWDFTDADTYEWTLYAKTPDGAQKAMGGTFKREK